MRCKLVEIPEPVPGPYQAKVRLEAACLCNATDRKLVEGHFPGVEDYPLLLGHENAGMVAAVGEKVRSFKVGDWVIGGLLLDTTDPAYASGWAASRSTSSPATTRPWSKTAWRIQRTAGTRSTRSCAAWCRRPSPWKRLCCSAPGACSTRAFGDFNLRPGDDILIFGGGPVGLELRKVRTAARPGLHRPGGLPARACEGAANGRGRRICAG